MERVATPSVALTAVLNSAAIRMKATTSETRESAGSNFATRRSPHTAATASRVLPLAIPAAVHQGASEPTLTANAASQIAGHSERPHKNRVAIAMPLGAHTVVI